MRPFQHLAATGIWLALSTTGGPAQPAQAPAASTESEPNDTPATADVVTSGDTVTGTIATSSDVDFFVVSLTAGGLLTLNLSSPSYYYLSLALMDTTGTTVLRYSEYYSGLRITFPVPATGRYYVRVTGYYYSGISYGLAVAIEPPGPGDPTRVFAGGLGVPWAMAADRTGDLFVLDRAANRIARVTPAGRAETWVMLPPGGGANDIALTAQGDVLVTAQTSGSNGAWRYARDTRARTRFTSRVQQPGAIAIGPDGDVWIAETYLPRLWRFDQKGAVKDSILVPYTGTAIFTIAFSPRRELHYAAGQAIWRLAEGGAETVVEDLGSFLGLAFDREGNLYAALSGYTSGYSYTTVQLYDADYRRVGSVFARSGLLGSVHLVFARDASGATTSTLLAANGYYYYGYGTPPAGVGAIMALNPDGVRARGWPVGVDFLIPLDSLRPGIVGASYADTLHLVGTSAAATWTVAAGTLPPGLRLDSLAGVLSGTPEQAGTFAFTAQARVSDRVTFRTLTALITEPALRVTDAIDALMGVPGLLSPELERFLDLKGNRNGKFDLGDLQAYLRAQGQLPKAPSAVPDTEES